MNETFHVPPTHGLLKIAIQNDDPKFNELYQIAVKKHNEKILEDTYPNAGFDLFFPQEEEVLTAIPYNPMATMISMDVKAQMSIYEPMQNQWKPCSYYLYPRSSISKTPLMLANHVGVIDSGYRGNIIGSFRNLVEKYTVQKYTRLLQICAPDLRPLYVEIVSTEDLDITSRNEGGFGSTGI
jgi:dUTPase